jgi:hypothetical protein
MKKNFPLHAPGKADARVVEGIKHDVRKYVQRERRKPVPEGFDQWDFACKVGLDVASAEPAELPSVGSAIDAVVRAGVATVYVEVVAVAALRPPRFSASPLPTTPVVSAAPVAPPAADTSVITSPSSDLPTHLL